MEVIITRQDVLAMPPEKRYCTKGLRLFCHNHGVSWQRFLAEGIPLSEVEHIDDQMLKLLIEKAKERCQEKPADR